MEIKNSHLAFILALGLIALHMPLSGSVAKKFNVSKEDLKALKKLTPYELSNAMNKKEVNE